MEEQPTRHPFTRRALWGVNALLATGIVAYCLSASPRADVAGEKTMQPTYTAPAVTPQQPVQTPAQQCNQPPTQHEEQPERNITIPGYDAYNALVPTIDDVAQREGVPAGILALIVLNESKGKGGSRYEPGFEQRYVQPVLDGSRDATHKKLRRTLETMLSAQAGQAPAGNSMTKETFAKQLATSYGPAQIMYFVAVERGFRGTAAELAEPTANLTFAARRVKAHSKDTQANGQYDWRKVLIDYNSGSAIGTPHPGYVERGTVYAKKLGL